MNQTRAFVTAGVVLAAIASLRSCLSRKRRHLRSAPTPAPAASAPASSKPSAATQVETWTKKQWDAAKKEWAKDKAKWADCRKQSNATETHRSKELVVSLQVYDELRLDWS